MVELIMLLFLNIVFPISFKRQTNILGLEDLEEAMYTTLLLFQPTTVKFALLFFLLDAWCSKLSQSIYLRLFAPNDSAFA